MSKKVEEGTLGPDEVEDDGVVHQVVLVVLLVRLGLRREEIGTTNRKEQNREVSKNAAGPDESREGDGGGIYVRTLLK